MAATPTVPEPTPAAERADGADRVVRTGGQNGLGAAAVIVCVFFARQLGWNGELTVEEALAFGLIGTVGFSTLSNLGKLRAK